MALRSNIILVLFLILQYTSTAQEKCGFDIVHKKMLRNNESYRKNVEEQEKFIQQYRKNQQSAQLALPGIPNASNSSIGSVSTNQSTTSATASASALYTIPVVVHVVHTGDAVGTTYNPSDADIIGAIDYLNQVYNGTYPGTVGAGDIQIQFVLALRDPSCNPTTAINRVNGSGLTNYVSNGVNAGTVNGTPELSVKNLSRWDPSRYYNIWLVNKIDGADGTSGSFTAGFAYFPGASASLDGTIILASQMKAGRRTLPHEMGHAFNLYHVFEDAGASTCSPNASCSTEGDRVCDTDPITSPSSTCRTGTNSCTGTSYSINTENNYMNYTACKTLFTQGQKDRMLAAAAGPYRISLTSSYALASLYPVDPYSAPKGSSCAPQSGAAGLGGAYAGVTSLNLAGRIVQTGSTPQDGGYKNNGTDCHALIPLSQGASYTLEVKLFGTNAEQCKGWIDYNNDGVFDNATEQIISYSENSVPPGRNSLWISNSFIVPVDAVVNTPLRMRIIDDLSTSYGLNGAISSGCSAPVYGQAEDYPVIISASFLLPAQTTKFTGRYNGVSVLLEWETSSEVNSDKFIVQRSSDGINFSDIANEKARGGANVRTMYAVNDRNISAGTYLYRLKMLDLDGQSAYSQAVSVTVTNKRNASLRILNNPASSYLEFEFPATAQTARFRIADMAGKTLLEGAVPKGTQRYRSYEISRLASGVYLLEFNTGDKREVQKFVKQ
jgi:Pregnancy-associated plasma protein-A/GEVED domain